MTDIPDFLVTVQPGRGVMHEDRHLLPGESLTLPGDAARTLIADGFVRFAQVPDGYTDDQLAYLHSFAPEPEPDPDAEPELNADAEPEPEPPLAAEPPPPPSAAEPEPAAA